MCECDTEEEERNRKLWNVNFNAYYDNNIVVSKLLTIIVMCMVCNSRSPRPSTATPFSLYGSRHKWLDNLPPLMVSVTQAINFNNE